MKKMTSTKNILRNIETLDEIAVPLLRWFHSEKRSLPWRESPTPYRVWVSEIMLQQTRVEAVKPYFERFVAALPDVRSLAQADEDMLMKLWEGLGYYSRARHLQDAARIVCSDHGGELPARFDDLLALPGIGRYTAGAIASIAFGEHRPAVDGNVLRVIMRLLASPADILKDSTKRAVEDALLVRLPKNAGDFNQALMELGALICLPRGAARCSACPLQRFCLAKAASLQGGARKNSRFFCWRKAEGSPSKNALRKDFSRDYGAFPPCKAILKSSRQNKHYKPSDLSLQSFTRSLPHSISSPISHGRWSPGASSWQRLRPKSNLLLRNLHLLQAKVPRRMHNLPPCCSAKPPHPTTCKQKHRLSTGRQRRRSSTPTACPPPTAAISPISAAQPESRPERLAQIISSSGKNLRPSATPFPQ